MFAFFNNRVSARCFIDFHCVVVFSFKTSFGVNFVVLGVAPDLRFEDFSSVSEGGEFDTGFGVHVLTQPFHVAVFPKAFKSSISCIDIASVLQFAGARGSFVHVDTFDFAFELLLSEFNLLNLLLARKKLVFFLELPQ